MFIKRVKAKLITNSRKESSVEIRIQTLKGSFICSAPSGKSKGVYETKDFNDRGVRWSVQMTNLFLKKFQNRDVPIKKLEDLELIEEELRKFEKHYGILGGNVYYSLEGALLKAAAKEKNQDLWEFIHGPGKPKIPMPVGNCIGGGLHTRTHFKKPDFQEFLFIANEDSFSKAVTKNILAYYHAKMVIRSRERRFRIKLNDENAVISTLTNQEVLEVMRDVAKKFNLKIGLDLAASSFFDKKSNFYEYKNKRYTRDKEEQLEYLSNLINEYDLFYVEDPFEEEDFFSFKKLLNYIKDSKKDTLIVGDDLTVTNLKRLQKAKLGESINAVIIKPNQIGSLIEVNKVVEFCKKNKIKMIFSHRSGETVDNLLGDYAVGFGADYIKTGILGKERLIKLKRIMDIESKVKANF